MPGRHAARLARAAAVSDAASSTPDHLRSRMPARRRPLQLLAGTAALLFATGCAADAPMDALDPAGPYAQDIHNLFVPVFWVAVAVFVLVEGAIIFAAIRFRRRGPDDTAVPEQVHGNTRLEIGWTIVPALILAVIAVPTVATVMRINAQPDDPVVVNVTGVQWWWQFEYPDEGIVTANELHVPAGRPVWLRITSDDVIHSFWAPRLSGKRDAVPGRVHTWAIEADEPGRYKGQCTEYCGLSHANMRLVVVAHDEAGWDAWLAAMQQPPDPPTAGGAREGYELFGQFCASCHQVDGQWEEVLPDSPLSPNLTHLATRECFAGCIFDMTRVELEAWLRDPPGRKPMAPDDGRGMPNLGLTEAQIDALVDYLETLQ